MNVEVVSKATAVVAGRGSITVLMQWGLVFVGRKLEGVFYVPSLIQEIVPSCIRNRQKKDANMILWWLVWHFERQYEVVTGSFEKTL